MSLLSDCSQDPASGVSRNDERLDTWRAKAHHLVKKKKKPAQQQQQQQAAAGGAQGGQGSQLRVRHGYHLPSLRL